MGLIIREVGILGSKNRYIKLKALFDTGAARNYISKEFVEEHTHNKYTIDDVGVMKYHGSDFVIFPDGVEQNGLIVSLKLLKIDHKYSIEEPKFFLLNMKMHDIIIGAKLMQQLKITLNPFLKEINFS